MVLLGPRRDASWEVVEHREVTPVPSYFDDSGIEITSISPHDVTQTFTFDRPVWLPPPSPSSSPSSSPTSKTARIKSKLHLTRSRSSSVNTQQNFPTVSSFLPSLPSSLMRSYSYNSVSSASDATSSDDEPSSSDSSYNSSLRSASGSRDFTPSQTRDALIFSRNQLLNSNELRKMGANVLFFEGWTVTKLRKGNAHRLQIKYTGRPAVATYSSPPSPSHPPFMDILGEQY
ncbi:hypothetical protein FRC03_005471 [Tulasnella sp. 419]|nr:hypothetical protein FRC02_001506 [Tulasnella sp. 418]KAG8968926.1 hypothetical protein FRC03_005471 [Tulasnella sp. 419]